MSERVREIETRVAQIDTEQQRLGAVKMKLFKEWDQIQLADRPEYPTVAQRLGLAEAVKQIKAGKKPATHHGDPVGPTADRYCVVVDGARGWLNVRHASPNAKATGSCYYLWDFTSDEIGSFVGILFAAGFSVTKFWRCDGGVSFEVEERVDE